MALFDVPGWSVPADPVLSTKKRKRPSKAGAAPEDDIASASMNVDKLMRSLDTLLAGDSGKGKAKAVILDDDDEAPASKKAKGKGKAQPKGAARDAPAPPPAPAGKHKTGKQTGEGKPQSNKKPLKESKPKVASRASTPDLVPPAPTPNQSKKKSRQKGNAAAEPAPVPAKASTSAPVALKPGMTALQAKMKSSLDGARFRSVHLLPAQLPRSLTRHRWINEELYKSDSTHALAMMRADPNVFAEYHTGFRHQVQAWPTNPVEHYATHLAKYPKGTVIADVGCGDAALAKALVPHGMAVLSFDLVSDNAYVIEADACAKLPLPGSEGAEEGEGEGEGQVVDVVVCALSLMGTNWPGTIREAWRVLKSG
jgi:ribosomal RNA-processing protein 8